MNRYLTGIDAIVGARREVARVSDVLGASTAIVRKPSTVSEFLTKVGATAPEDVPDGIGTLGGAVAGLVLVKQHRLLGAIGGASLGRNVPALFRPAERPMAVRNMGITGAAIAGSLLAGTRFGVPGRVGGFLVGWLVGGAVAYLGGY